MNVFVEAPDYEHLFVVAHWLTAEELLGLLQAAIGKSHDLVCFRVEVEAVTYPTIVSAENQDFTVVEGERSESVSW